jgi:hypothetical protein
MRFVRDIRSIIASFGTEIEQVLEHSIREENITDERSHKLDSHVEITSMDDQRANYFVLDPTETAHNRSDSSAHAQSTGYHIIYVGNLMNYFYSLIIFC